jgi:hypothetical protein
VTTESELRGADLATGLLSNPVEAVVTPWLWFHHNLSGDLRPKLPLVIEGQQKGTLRETLDREMTRSIAIVSPDGVKSFLNNLPLFVEHSTDRVK